MNYGPEIPLKYHLRAPEISLKYSSSATDSLRYQLKVFSKYHWSITEVALSGPELPLGVNM